MSLAHARRPDHYLGLKTRLRPYVPIQVFASTETHVYLRIRRSPRKTYFRIVEIANSHGGRYLPNSKLWAIPKKRYLQARKEMDAALER